ncbi:hypothetical protein CAURIC_10450 [Corynebacterium auriscanis]|nr:hypothetical protein [Corynebacterium auriscanis]WJY73689.1 hypothetical protein CAURIC_10450 [Corynebacterium auriscanis]
MALYENNGDLSLNAASAELGINRASLHSWVKKYGTGKRARIKAVHDKAQAANDSEQIRKLEKENAQLREERDILHKPARSLRSRTGICLVMKSSRARISRAAPK